MEMPRCRRYGATVVAFPSCGRPRPGLSGPSGAALFPALVPVLMLVAGCAAPARRPGPVTTAVASPQPGPATQPAWVARKVVPDAVAVPGGRLHTVKSGETGIAIARAYGVAWRDVVAANNLSPPYVLRVGDRLLLPGQQKAADQTLEQRARNFRLDIDDIVTGGEPAAAAGTTRPGPSPDLAANAPVFRWPAEGRILSAFGPKPGGRVNDGINIKVAAGSPVRAAADGTIAYAGDAIPGFGNLLLIRHAGGWVTAYGHNETLLVERGKVVKAGEVIARAGDTGQVSEPQLHFEVRRGRTALDPQTLLPRR